LFCNIVKHMYLLLL